MSKVESIITKYSDFCAICGRPRECWHHGMSGTANRKVSDSLGAVWPLCEDCHTGASSSIHRNHRLDKMCKIATELAVEKHFVASGMSEAEAREEFRRLFGKNCI